MKPTAPAPARLLAIFCLSIALAALALAGCGGGSAAPGKGATTAASTPTAGAKPQAHASPGSCASQLGPFLASIDTLRRKLEVGLSYEQYVAEVGAVKAAYAQLPVDRLPLDCLLKSGTPAERAFDKYIAAANTWGECLAETGCTAGTIESTLQDEWHLASHFLGAAASG